MFETLLQSFSMFQMIAELKSKNWVEKKNCMTSQKLHCFSQRQKRESSRPLSPSWRMRLNFPCPPPLPLADTANICLPRRSIALTLFLYEVFFSPMHPLQVWNDLFILLLIPLSFCPLHIFFNLTMSTFSPGQGLSTTRTPLWPIRTYSWVLGPAISP